MSNSRKATRGALLIMVLSLGSKFLGFIREMLIAANFGSGIETDTYFIAMSATGIITGLITSAVSSTSIPVLSEVEVKEGKKGKIKYTSNIINIVLIAAIFLVIVAYIYAPTIIRLLARGFEGEQFTLAVSLVRIGLPMILFSGVIGAFTGFLQSEERYFATAAIGFPFNFVYIFYLVFLSSRFGIKGLMVAAVLAVVAQLLIQLPESKAAGFKYYPVMDFKNKYIQKVLNLSVPILVGVAINDLNAIVDKTLASSLPSGSISALSYSNKLLGLITGVFISAITTTIFPILSRESNNNNIKGLKKIMGYGVNFILIITIPATVGLMVLSRPIVEVVFQRGVFYAQATDMTSTALIFYSLGLVAMSLRLLITRVYYSLQDTKTPMVNGAISVAFNIVLNLILVRFMAHGGLALATSIATTIAMVLLFYGLKQKIGSLGTLGYIRCGIKSALASLVMGVVAHFTYQGLYKILGIGTLNNLISLVIAIILAVIVYIVLCYILGIDEIKDILNKAINKIKKV